MPSATLAITSHTRERVRERLGTNLPDARIDDQLRALWELGRELKRGDLSRFGTGQIDGEYRIAVWREYADGDYHDAEVMIVARRGAIRTVLVPGPAQGRHK